ncbi:MaoC family dehydratase [Nocardia seriolae]|uniref:MaoC family dehydratase n=1 Tax=Nocardia seriolae TaxID=37332 RepID=UPI000EF231FA|nr:MaoC family dehydratase [Nocardia seriolae]RLP33151.1 MaoC family dehydratase [Nocardia seriolae]WKY50500.1 MaoC family dehydratase [Nocardia seriolae]
MIDFNDFDRLRAAVGTELGVSDWITVDQKRIDTFADATDDHQWIHVDAERAAAGPYGRTIAHGFLTLSLVVPMTAQVMTVSAANMAINYGLNKVRFINPVRVDSRIRGRFTLDAVTDIPGGVQAVRTVTVEIEGQDKPAGVAESIARYLS